MVSLREAGLVTSTRGAHGGYELARPPETISMADGPARPRRSHRPDALRERRSRSTRTLCDRSSRCTVNVLWVRVRDAVAGALDSMTLADLVPPRISIVRAHPADPLQGAPTDP